MNLSDIQSTLNRFAAYMTACMVEDDQQTLRLREETMETACYLVVYEYLIAKSGDSVPRADDVNEVLNLIKPGAPYAVNHYAYRLAGPLLYTVENNLRQTEMRHGIRPESAHRQADGRDKVPGGGQEPQGDDRLPPLEQQGDEGVPVQHQAEEQQDAGDGPQPQPHQGADAGRTVPGQPQATDPGTAQVE